MSLALFLEAADLRQPLLWNSITICFIRMSQLLPFLQFLEALLTDVMLNPAGFQIGRAHV